MMISNNVFAHRLAVSLTAALLLASWTPIIADADRPDAAAPTHVSPGDKLARPSPVQYAWHEQERLQFVCLDPCTWQGREYDDHSTPLAAINPTQLDTDQWCRAARLWGAKEILFVAKHTGGFCWWQTETTQYGIHAVIFQGPQATIRWAGTESGVLPYPAWNSLKSTDLQTGVATVAHGTPDGDAWAPLEADTTLYNHNWFWSAANEKKRKSLDQLMEIYCNSAGHGGVLLLNSTPNTNGLIPADDLKPYEAFGREIARRFGRPRAEAKDRRGTSVELVFPKPTLINHAVIMEDYREGERIREYVLEGYREAQWLELSKGTSVGRKKIDPFGPVQVQRVRLRVGRSAAEPLIRSLAVFYAP